MEQPYCAVTTGGMYIEHDSMLPVGPGWCMIQEFSGIVLSSPEHEWDMGEETKGTQLAPIWKLPVVYP